MPSPTATWVRRRGFTVRTSKASPAMPAAAAAGQVHHIQCACCAHRVAAAAHIEPSAHPAPIAASRNTITPAMTSPMATRMLATVAPATRCGPRYLLLTAAAESVSYGSSAAAA
ncbi:Uncharacterised protein [Mycobacteroides abscessus subsp. abscessus]|nr:Uncharacterised protein [Mycobacteroides abscessus subsp. abscessus]